MLNRTLHGDFFITSFYTVTRDMNYLAHHFSPSTVLLAPFLLLTETRNGYAYGIFFFNLMSIYTFFLLTRSYIEERTEVHLLIFLFSINLYIYRILMSYHFETLFLGLFFLLAYLLKIKKQIPALTVFGVTLLLKEDMPVYLFLFSAFYAMFFEVKQGTIGMFLAGTVFYITPLIQQNLDYEVLVNWKVVYLSWGGSYSEIIASFIKNPMKVADRILPKWKLLMELFIGTGIVWLMEFRLLFVIFPIIFLHLISDRPWHNEFNHYYSYAFIPFIFYGLIISYTKIRAKLTHQKRIALLLFLAALVFYRNSFDSDFPLHFKSVDMERVNTVKKASGLIPPDKGVSVQFDLGAMLPRNVKLYPLRNGYPLQEYILMDAKKGFSPYLPLTELTKMKNYLLQEKKYTIEFEKDGVVLLRKL